MEKLTPIELERAQLPRGLKGYRVEAVDKILSSASQQIESQLLEIRRLNSILKAAECELEIFRAQEGTLKSALVLTQKNCDEARANAHSEAASIIEEAKLEAKELKRQANDSLLAVRFEIERLESDKRAFAARYRALLNEHLERIECEAPRHAVLQVEERESATG
ncbi:MAG: DivIVA domain-containing protein [Chthonomonadaceae bacterium]|nr:DivIVA domain-containing protein [Chthonomonadaceae bacterium]